VPHLQLCHVLFLLDAFSLHGCEEALALEHLLRQLVLLALPLLLAGAVILLH
jgi:hypothetical protein